MSSATLGRLRLFTLREFLSHWRRSVASVAVVTVSAALLVAVIGLYGSLTGSVDQLATGIAGNADLEVAGITDSGFDQSLQGEVAGVPGVQAAVPMLRTTLVAGATRTMLIGVDASIAKLDSDLQKTVESSLASGSALLSVPNGVAVGPGMGTPTGASVTVGSGTATVAAVLSSADARRINDGQFVIAPLPLAQKLASRLHRIDSVLIVTAPGADVGQVRAAVADVVAGRAIVAKPDFRTAQAGNSVALIKYSVLMGSAVALVVSAFLVFNAMNMAVTQRRPTISMLRALGARRSVIARDLVLEAAALGLVGAAIGAPLGILMGRWSIGRLPPFLVQSVDARIHYVLPSYAIPLAIVACVAASIGASTLAARQVYRVAPIEALAPVGASSTDTVGGPLYVFIGVVSAAVLAAAIVMAYVVQGRIALVAVAILFIGMIGLCVAGTTVIVRATAVVARLLGAAGRIGSATVERAPRRVWATVVTVAVAVALSTSVIGSNANMIASASASFADVGTPDLYVCTTAVDAIPTGPLLAPNIAPDIAALPGVASVVPGQTTYATVGDTRFLMQGMSRDSNAGISTNVRGELRKSLLAGDGIVLSRDVARALNLRADDTMNLPTPQGIQHVKVLATVDYFSALTGAAALPLSSVQKWYGRPGANYVELHYTAGSDHAATTTAVQKIATPANFTYSGAAAKAGLNQSLVQGSALLSSLQWVVALVAAIALLNTLMLSVLERRREIGVLRAMGSSGKFALQMVLAEAAAIGIVGGLLGLVMGAFGHWLDTVVTSSVATIHVEYHLVPSMFVYAGAALLLSLLGSIPPALRAARLNIIDAVAAE
ncbi:ABC transporter permease [Antrihabitans cavernicola]|uniref:FtsX-like permease family protein n=1 Tax=Antrihabitans cavernicola TaxID=2495913 RepID=A0A5A7S9N5_9NOCA|nr:FtsX-like permease family protein [Spelaeibacter cavernicola]KAA0022194.1 FtsX-like permease family protein [Spelaeibacter cavernicola]